MSDHLRALREIVRHMPAEGSVSLPVSWLKELLAEGVEPGTRLLTLEEASEVVNRSPSTIRTWANTGQLDGAFKLQGRSWRIPASAIESLIERQQSGQHEPPTVQGDGPVNLSSWRQHMGGAA